MRDTAFGRVCLVLLSAWTLGMTWLAFLAVRSAWVDLWLMARMGKDIEGTTIFASVTVTAVLLGMLIPIWLFPAASLGTLYLALGRREARILDLTPNTGLGTAPLKTGAPEH